MEIVCLFLVRVGGYIMRKGTETCFNEAEEYIKGISRVASAINGLSQNLRKTFFFYTCIEAFRCSPSSGYSRKLGII